MISDEASEEEEEEESENEENGSLVDGKPALTNSTLPQLRARPKNLKVEKARKKAELLRRVSRIVRKAKKGDEVMRIVHCLCVIFFNS